MRLGRRSLVAGAALIAASLTWAVWPSSSSQHRAAGVQHLAPSIEQSVSGSPFRVSRNHRTKPSLLPPLHSRKPAVDLLQPSPLARFDPFGTQEPDISKVRCIVPAEAPPQETEDSNPTVSFGFKKQACMSFPDVLDYALKHPSDREAMRLVLELLPELDEFMPEKLKNCMRDLLLFGSSDPTAEFLACQRLERLWKEGILFDTGLFGRIMRHVHADPQTAATFAQVVNEDGSGDVFHLIKMRYMFGRYDSDEVDMAVSILSDAGVLDPWVAQEMKGSEGCTSFRSFFDLSPHNSEFLGYTQEDLARQCNR